MKLVSRIILGFPFRREITAGPYCCAYVPLLLFLLLLTTGLHAATPQLLGPALNVTSMAGQASLLTCVVRHIGDKTVSWIRQRDLAILSSGLAVYTSDDRIDVLHPSNSDLWHLRIDDVRKSDQGIYECQVNTDPKLFAAIALIVLDSDPREQAKDSPYYGPPTPKTKTTAGTVKIPGPPERTLNPGETASFICTANDFPELPQSLTWRHQGRIVGENARTKKTLTSGLYTLSSRLDILQVESDDDGDYECSVANGPWASVRLHIQGGHSGTSQRMTRSSGTYRLRSNNTPLVSILVTLSALFYFMFAYWRCF